MHKYWTPYTFQGGEKGWKLDWVRPFSSDGSVFPSGQLAADSLLASADGR